MPIQPNGTYLRQMNALSGSDLWQQRAAQANPLISASEHDAEMNDVATAITGCLKANGTTTPTANLPMNGFKHTGVAAATGDSEYTTRGQIRTGFSVVDWTIEGTLNLAQSTYSNNLSLGINRTSNAQSLIDFHTDTTVAGQEARILRETGANGNFAIVNQGTGITSLQGVAGPVQTVGTAATMIAQTGSAVVNSWVSDVLLTAGTRSISLSQANGLQIQSTDGNEGGFIQTTEEAGTANKVRIYGARSNGGVVIRTNNSGTIADRVIVPEEGHLQPVTDNSNTCGASGKRWSAIWAANGTIQTSDERTKTDITDSSLGLAFVKALRPVSYKWIEGSKVVTGQVDGQEPTTVSIPGQRTHFGLIAQEVAAAIPSGVDFGGWILTDKNDPTSQQALRYDQFIAPLIAAVKELSARVESLETELATLKGA